MAQLSKREISEEVWEQTWEWLVYIIGVNDSTEGVNVLLSGLLTKTERVMIAKRLMVGVLLLSGWPPQAIAKKIALSISTVYKLRELLEVNEAYRELVATSFEEIIGGTESGEGEGEGGGVFGKILSKGKNHR